MASRSPTAVTPLPKSSVAPETPMVRDAPANPQAVPFPSPQTFDIVPPLHGLLSRLLSPPTNAAGVSNGVRAADDPTGAGAPTGPPSGTPGQPQSQQQAGAENTNTAGVLGTVPSAGPGGAEISGLGSNSSPALDIKDLPTEVSSIKIRIQKAQAVVENLPDVDRSVADQEEEIEELEDRIAKLKSVIADFGQMASPGGAKKLKSQGP
ncbi:RNA polymerase II mediator complex middle subunit MED9 [Aspergillus luchuensis]|uniref:Mediator of RNA polymerase II transcription subunit 9 n=1 Tax=Aspergillus kawachii TaxID=1069201 RepID=A0A146FGQ7_ASPKA|nr:uncharacterized protein AKAW2_70260A [Aspergillus luchuensis]BCS03381.1 hypothetical protein AKAW2_70260A [Aspergillus luchuensis]BCS15009.1 hypothetical protein ALUC_70242A [Aspergillus luchuensis]GAA84911.1 similar to An16g02980 [Aspergillus luchuensis IFO 4308]GAT24481.1 similar to An16g02980 [Aspergillus luchuensis]